IADGLTSLGRAFQSNGASIDGAGSAYERAGVRLRGIVDRIKELWSAYQSGGFKELWDNLKSGGDKASDGFKKAEGAGASLSDAMAKLGDAGSSVGRSLLSLT